MSHIIHLANEYYFFIAKDLVTAIPMTLKLYIRNHMGHSLFGFSMHIGITTNNWAELWDVCKGLAMVKALRIHAC